MVNKIINNDDEIDLLNLFKVIWDRKSLIFLIVLISALISISYVAYKNHQIKKKPKIFQTSVILYPLDDSQVIRFNKINHLLKINQKSQYSFHKDKLFEQFVSKLSDQSLTEFFVKDNIYIQKIISKLSGSSLLSERKKFVEKFVLIKNDSSNYILNFTFSNKSESVVIVSEYLNFINNELIKDYLKKLDLVLKIQNEENEINKKLKISQLENKKNILDSINLLEEKSKKQMLFDINFQLQNIDGEINVMTELFLKEIEKINDDKNKTQLVNFLSNSPMEHLDYLNEKKTIIISIILGFLIGIVITLILHSVNFKKIKARTDI